MLIALNNTMKVNIEDILADESTRQRALSVLHSLSVRTRQSIEDLRDVRGFVELRMMADEVDVLDKITSTNRALSSYNELLSELIDEIKGPKRVKEVEYGIQE